MRFWLLIFFAVLASSSCFAKPSTPAFAAQLSAQYRIVGASFWRGENLLDAQIETLPDRNTLLASPIAANSIAGLEYSRAASGADSFLKLADENNITSWTRDPVIYFGALSHYTIGNYARAAELFARLAPDYKRDVYINDRDRPNPEYSVPTRLGISKLLFYARLKSLPEKPDDAFIALQDITREALSTLGAQREYAHYLANRPIIHDRRTWSESIFGGQPDQRRAGALPPTLQLVETAWDSLLEKAVQRNAKSTRDFLRGLSTPDAPLSKLAIYKLQTIDALIIKNYFAEAQRLMNAKNFDGARAKYRQIIAEYSGSETATRAEAELPKIVPVAVEYYKSEAQKNFQPVDKIGVPQTKAREYFEKLLKEAPDSDFALYYYSRALATENKTDQALAQLQRFQTTHKDSDLRAQALFLQGFLLGSKATPDYNRAVTLLDQVAKEYQSSPEASEALFYAGTYLAWQNRFPEAITRLSQIEKYPNSIRRKWAVSLVERLEQKIKDGTKWP